MAARYAIIMAGGSGERFWPLSRPDRPKQLLRLTSPTHSMLEEAVRRVEDVVGAQRVVVATGKPLEEPVRSAAIVSEGNVWAEPAKRNTLGCLAWVSANLLARGQADASVAILTADHRIAEDARFRAIVSAALDVAERRGGIVTIGIVPTRPETGYGYIEMDQESAFEAAPDVTAYRSVSFREKPSARTAEEFVSSGRFLWNAGMFFFTLAAFMRELERSQPHAYGLVHEMAAALRAGNVAHASVLFEGLPSISVDYAVMEKASEVYVIPGDFPWDDMGAWDALERSFETDASDNVLQGRGVLIDSHGCVVYNDMQGTTIGVLGMRDVIVVATEAGILVCPKDQAQRVRELAQQAANLPPA